jgi:hypothetical protein
MSDRLIDAKTGVAVGPNDIIRDTCGRPWAFWFCTKYGLQLGNRNGDPEIYVKRITNGKPSRTEVAFGPDFFPGYRIERPSE